MKKFLMTLLFIFLNITFVAGAVFFVQGCSTSIPENGGGGISDPGEDITDPDNDNNDKNDDDKDAEQNATITFTVKQLTLSHGGATYSTTTSGLSNHHFNLTWHEGDGGWGNGDAKTWGNALTTYGDNVTGGGKNDTYANNLCYAYYYWTGTAQRQAKIVITGSDSVWALWDFSSNTTTPDSRDTSTTYYFWGSGSYSTSIGSKTGTSMSGTWYVHYRMIYTVSFDLNGGSGSFSNQSWYHGIKATLPTTAPTKTGYTFAGWAWNGEVYGSGDTISASKVDNISAAPNVYAQWTANTYTVSFAKNGGSGTMSDMTATYDSNFSVTNNYSRTGYTFVGWIITGCDSNKHYYGTSDTDQLVTTDTEITTDITGTGYYKNLTATSGGKVTFTARWEINTYTLTIKYNVCAGNNDTSLSITQSSSTVSASSIAAKSIATVKHTYQTGALSVAFARTNTSYSYYISVGNVPTKSSPLNSATYSWTPTADKTIIIYVYQRYTITYNSNNGSGTTPSTQYKIDGTDETIATNSLTRTSYRANGWNTATDRSGTSYTDGQAYKSNASVTLYANWSASYAVIAVRIKTSSDGITYANSIAGGTATISYKIDSGNTITSSTRTVNTSTLTSVSQLIEQTATITGTAKDGYVYVGVAASSATEPPGDPNSLSVVPTTKGQTYTYYVYFVKISNNQLKYQSQYTVTDVDGTKNYGFAKNSSGYWESQNQQIASSYSLVKVEFILSKTCDITFKVINYAEANYDFGIFSKLDTTLTASYSEDSTNVYKSFKGSSSANVVDLTYSNVSAGEHYIYVKFRKDSSNNYYNDSLQFKLVADGLPNSYFYFEDGEYPQSYVGDKMNETLINNASTISTYLQYIDGDDEYAIPIYEYKGERYAKLELMQSAEVKLNDGTMQLFEEGMVYFFVVEPIRWRVSDYGVEETDENWGKYGTYKTNFTAVSDKILTFSSVSITDEMYDLVEEYWRFVDSNLYYAISESGNTYSATNFIGSTYKNLDEQDYEYDYFGPPGQQNKVLTEKNSEAVLRVASIDEIQQDLTDMRASASDFVCAYLGVSADKYCDYWTRNLGQYLKNGKVITSYGMEKSTWLNKLCGVRFSITFAEGSRLI